MTIFRFRTRTSTITGTMTTPNTARTNFHRARYFHVNVANFRTDFGRLAPSLQRVIFLYTGRHRTLETNSFNMRVGFAHSAARYRRSFQNSFATQETQSRQMNSIFLSIDRRIIIEVLRQDVFQLRGMFIPTKNRRQASNQFAGFAAMTFTIFHRRFFRNFGTFGTSRVRRFLAQVDGIFTRIIIGFSTLFHRFHIRCLDGRQSATATTDAHFNFDFRHHGNITTFISNDGRVAFNSIRTKTSLHTIQRFVGASEQLTTAEIY